MKEKFIVYYGNIEGDTDYKFFETEDEAFDYAWNVKKYKTPKELKNCVIEMYSTKNEDVDDMEEWQYLCSFNPLTLHEFIKEIKRFDIVCNKMEIKIVMCSNEVVYVANEEGEYFFYEEGKMYPNIDRWYDLYKMQNNG